MNTRALAFMNAAFVGDYKLHQTLTSCQKKVYHDKKCHQTFVWCALTTLFHFLYRKLAKYSGVQFFVIFVTRTDNGILPKNGVT